MSSYDSDLFELTQEGRIYTLTMCKDDNRITKRFLDEINTILDHLDATEEPIILVLASRHPTIFCNGFDIDELMKDPEVLTARLGMLGFRILAASYVTIAMINGHAYAGGAYLAISCDYKVMRKERGYICFNEGEIGLKIPQPLYDFSLSARISVSVIHELAALCSKFTAEEAVTRGIIQTAVTQNDLKRVTYDIAGRFAERNLSRKVLKETKMLLYREQAERIPEWKQKIAKANL
mmetsp:Transcript_7497/g.8189  ORF Transcript_7497/g.8189 Transcript_7497/m.8189 type:complete len:236 (+) Transcript_7497:30-737(+)